MSFPKPFLEQVTEMKMMIDIDQNQSQCRKLTDTFKMDSVHNNGVNKAP